MALLDSPRLRCIEKGGEYDSFVDLDLCHGGDASSVPYILVGSAEGSTCFGESGVDLIVNDYIAGKRAAKVGELVNRIESLPVDGNVGFYIRFSWSGLVHPLCLLGADCETEFVTGFRECVHCIACPLQR